MVSALVARARFCSSMVFSATLCHAAAAGNFLCAASGLSANAYRTVLEIDTMGTFNVCRAAYDAYMGKHGGVIINITATLDYRGLPMQMHAGTAKAAIGTRLLVLCWGML